MTKKVIFLDWYKTLSPSVFWEHLKESDAKKYKIITITLFEEKSDLINPWMRGQLSSEEVSRTISKHSNLDYEYIFDNLVESAKEMNLYDVNILNIIQKIRNNYKVVIATDNMDTFSRWTVQSLNFNYYFDDYINSWEVKALKSDFDDGESKFFLNYLSDHKLKPSDCMLIDDSEDKENKISHFGIDYLRIKHPSEVTKILESLNER